MNPLSIAVVALSSSAFALTPQGDLRARPVPGPLRDAGVYHVATGTWTRGGAREELGPKVLYANTAQSGFYGVNQLPGVGLVWTDEGRLPSTSGHANATADSYVVNGFEIAYCSQEYPNPQLGAIAFYECYAACTDPTGLPALFATSFSLPSGWTGAGTCWIVTFDLTGTTDEFVLAGDCDGAFDGSTALDGFGWTLVLEDFTGNGFNGPLLNGDPNNFPYGDGTYYQSPGATIGTGLDTQDRFWSSELNGCFWFGGYPSNPFASFWLRLHGDNGDDCLCSKYCAHTDNSTGAPADISLTGTSAAAGDVITTAAPVPNQPGIFFHGASQSQIPFGDGFLCTTGDIARGAIVVPSANVATYQYDNSDAKHSLLPHVGATRNFQYWFRDPMAGGALFNTSNAVNWTVQ